MGAAALSVCGLLTVSAAVQAQPATPVSPASAPLELAVQAEKIVVAEDGRTALAPAADADPGDTLLYTVTFRNASDGAIDHVRITQAIPPGVAYIEGTAVAPGALVLFSVDGGATFGLPAELVVTGENGRRRRVAAADYTHVRWVLAAPLDARATGFARFRAEMR